MLAKNILGKINHAFYLGAKWLPPRRIVRAARYVGAGKRLLEVCFEYAQTWEIFGRTISGQTRAQRILADMTIDIHAARLMVYHAACMADKGEDIRRARCARSRHRSHFSYYGNRPSWDSGKRSGLCRRNKEKL